MERYEGTPARILEATREVLLRSGHRKLSMWDVAAEAGVSRPTLYRWFPSKEVLLEAFGLYEQRKYDDGMAAALANLDGLDALDAALQFIVDFQRTYSLTGTKLSEVEPEHVLFQMERVLPIMRKRISTLIDDVDAETIAGAIVRIAVCHYVIDSDDQQDFLAQLRHAAGIVVS